MRRPRPPDEVYFPVVPMLDMSFQLLAFFILTFQPPNRESRIDLDLPAAPVALSRSAGPVAPPEESLGIDTDMVLIARADEAGGLAALNWNGTMLDGIGDLGERARKYVAILGDHPVRMTLVADSGLRYEVAAQLIGTCVKAGVDTVRLAGDGRGP